MKKCSTKLWKIMKLCAAQAMIAIVISGVSLAHDNYAQLLDKKVTLEVEDVSLEQALYKLQDASEVKIFFSLESLEMEGEGDVSLRAHEETLRKILDQLLTPHSIRYKVDEKSNSIIILKKEDSRQMQDAPIVSSRSLKMNTLFIVTGNVTDAVQQPLAGVNIVIKGTANGTTSDAEGKYSINARENDVLVFSFIGYAPFETDVATRTVIDVTMIEDVTGLGEVVVNAGYYEVKNSEKTGNISTVSSQEITKQPVSNPMQALQGRMPGVLIQQQSGVPGGGFKIQIRGQNSLRNDGNEPLYIVDGVPYPGSSFTGAASTQIIPNGNPLSALNPDDIEAIDILKDADATAIYGSRGANGVVLITTKRGKEGNPRVEVGVYSGISQVSHFMNLLSTPQYLEMRKEALQNDGLEPGFFDADITDWDYTRQTNWQEELLGGTASITNVKASLSGGTKDTQYLVGMSYLKQTTVFPGEFSDQKISGHISINHNPSTNRFGFAFSTSYVFDNNDLLRNDLTRYITLAPNTPEPYDEQGNLNWENSTWQNPYAFLKRPYQGETGNLISSLTLKYNLWKGLTLKTNLGYNDTNIREFSSFPTDSYDPGDGVTTGTAVFSSNQIRTWNIEPQIEYATAISKGTLTVLAGTTFLQTITKGEDIEASGFTNNSTLENKMFASRLRAISTRDVDYRYTAFFGRVNFNWDTKYLINLTARRDGSSRFGPEARFANFGAIGAAWIFSNEHWLVDNGIISFGKLRSSHGITGSDQIGDYQYLDSYRATSQTYQGTTGLIPTRLANASYSWESNRKFEAGLDLGFSKNRLVLGASWFSNRSSNQLVGLALPSITGFTSIQSNFPATVENRGLELELQSTNIKHQKFSWTSAANITIPRNKLVSYPNLAGSSYANTYEVGKSVYVKKMYHYTGVDPQTGLITFEDRNNNGIGTDYPADLQSLKEITQSFYGGLQNSLVFGGLQVSFFIQFVKQTGYAYLNSSTFVAPGRKGNQMVDVMDRWQRPGDIATHQKFTSFFASPAASTYSISTYAGDNSITDASFVRLQNVFVSWDLPQHIAAKIKLMNARIYMQGQNLITLTDYKGLSPETQSQSVLPPLRTVTLGLQLSL